MKEIEMPRPIMPIQESTMNMQHVVFPKVPLVTDLKSPVPDMVRLSEKEQIIVSRNIQDEVAFPKEEIAKMLPVRTPEDVLPQIQMVTEKGKIFPEESLGEQMHEQDFKTFEAKNAYDAFMEAARIFDAKTGEGGEKLMKTIDDAQKHVKEMSPAKLLSLMMVCMSLLIRIWGEKNGANDDEEKRPVKTSEAIDADAAQDPQKPLVSLEVRSSIDVQYSRLEKLSLAA